MSLRNRLMLLSLVVLSATMALWGWIQLSELKDLLYKKEERSLLGIAETVSTYYQHFPTGQGLAALDTALSEQLREDPNLVRIDLLSVANGMVEYLSGVGRAPFEWSADILGPILKRSGPTSFPLYLDGISAVGVVHRVPHTEQGTDPRAQVCVCVIAYTRTNDELISDAKSLLVYSSSGLLLLILIILALSYGWLIGSPLKSITRVIDQFHTGNYGKRIEIKRSDELAHLAGHFNSMADEIEKVLASNEELNCRQEEKIRDATQRVGELQRQVSQLQRLSAMGFLAANLAHDLGTPLHSIAGMANLLLERQGLPHEDRRKLELIVQQAERLSDVIRNVRRATRLPEPRPESVTMSQLFEETLPLVEPLLRNAGIRLKTEIAQDCPPLFADRHRMQTALLNLMQNAIEAIKGEGEITVAAGPSKDHASIVIGIDDTGVGISNEALNRVREPFFSTHGDDPLRGLGLAIVQDVVKVHGGRMAIESDPGKGTSVKLYFPVSVIPSEASLDSS